MPTIFNRLKILICESPLEFDPLLPKLKLDVLLDREIGPKGDGATHDNQSVTALSPLFNGAARPRPGVCAGLGRLW
jgi:hypothetical protein